MEATEAVGSEDAGIFALLFEGSQMESITLALDDTDQTLDPDEMNSLAIAEGGLILYQDGDGEWGIEFFEDSNDMDERWIEWESEARAAYGETMESDTDEF